MFFDIKKLSWIVAVSMPLLLGACSGDDGDNGARGPQGEQGPQGTAGEDGTQGPAGESGGNGLNSLVSQLTLEPGHDMCFNGGVQISTGTDADNNGTLDESEIDNTSYVCTPTTLNTAKNFNRIASFTICSQIDKNCDTDEQTVSEIVSASADGMTLVYTDSERERIGFIDVTNPNAPVAAGTVALSGEPTSVYVTGDYALVGVNTSKDFIDVSGELAVVNIASQTIITTIGLSGQPDSVATSPDGAYAAIVIENERDEELGDGVPPQMPAGHLTIVTLDGEPADWSTRNVNLTGIADLYPADPEPEYVDINEDNMAVVSLQENNHLAIINLADGSILNHFSAGNVDLTQVDVTEEEPALISQTQSLESLPREPDGVAWINSTYFVTADEGDLDGGSRSFSIFNVNGEMVYNSGSDLDQLTARFGHYPDSRSGNKGSEPENVEVGTFGGDRYLFVNSERASLIFVYDIANPTMPVFKQALPAAMGPEGALAIPGRNLLVAASEEDDREGGFRAAVNIYSYATGKASYPTLQSTDRWDGTPISWGALSGLAADSVYDNILYAIEDSAYQRSRIFTIDTSQSPAMLTRETHLVDSNDVLASLNPSDLSANTLENRNLVFDATDLDEMINDDKTVNLDPEGIAKAGDGGFWIATEGAGSVSEPEEEPLTSLNLIFKTDSQGVIQQVITLPVALNDNQLRFGFEGVAEYDGALYVAFQRAWEGDADVRIGKYDLTAGSWSFFYYELDAPESANGGWVGLSDISSLGDGRFLVVERDNQSGPDAAVKRLYTFDISGLTADSVVTKTLIADLTKSLPAKTGGLFPEKIEGSAVLPSGEVWIVNDNDGVDDNSGETQLLNLGHIVNY